MSTELDEINAVCEESFVAYLVMLIEADIMRQLDHSDNVKQLEP